MTPSTVPGIPEAALARLPIFPLPGLVLFPGALMPLHIFEQRYRAMVEVCLEEDRAVAVARLMPGYEDDYAGRPPVYPVMGAGIIVAAERLPDERWNIVVHGTDRVRCVHELPPDEPFRRVRAVRVPDLASPDDPERAETLRAVVQSLAESVPEASRPLMELLDQAPDPGRLADLLASQTLPDPDLRHALLEEPEIARRLSRVIEELGRLCLRVAGGPGEGPPN